MRKVKITFVCDLMGEKQVVPLEAKCGLAAILLDEDGDRNPIVVSSGEQYEHIALVAGVLRGLLEHEGPEAVERCLEMYRTCEVHEIGALDRSGQQVPINRLREQP